LLFLLHPNTCLRKVPFATVLRENSSNGMCRTLHGNQGCQVHAMLSKANGSELGQQGVVPLGTQEHR
jgi:hypothetical protein